MKHWAFNRRLSFWIHAVIVIVPLSFSTVSAWWFWHDLFSDAVIASSMIVVVDALALTGLILYILRIPSPFQALRHVLPFVSVVPLGIELYRALGSTAGAPVVAVLVTAIMVTVAALCFRTIEQLFIPPLDAAREKAQQEVQALILSMEQLRVVSEAVEVFRAGMATDAATETDSIVTMPSLTKTDKVKQLAADAGVTERTMWRRVEKGEVSL